MPQISEKHMEHLLYVTAYIGTCSKTFVASGGRDKVFPLSKPVLPCDVVVGL